MSSSQFGSFKGRKLQPVKGRSFNRGVSIPSSVAARLQHFRNKRKEAASNDLTLSNLLSVTAVQRAMASSLDRRDETEARQRSRTEPATPPSRLQRKASRAESAGALNVSTGLNAVRDLVDDAKGLARRVTMSGLGGGFDPDGTDEGGKVLTFVTPEVNRKIRKQLLRQHWFTNRFTGSAEAARAEVEFMHFSSRYHIKRVRSRLLITAVFLCSSAIEPCISGMSNLLPYLLLHSIAPVLCMLIATWLCHLRFTRPYWRTHVVVGAVCAYTCVLCSDSVIDVSGWSRASQDYSTVLQCVWMMISSQYFSLSFALDFLHNFILITTMWCSFFAGATFQVFRWRRLSAHYNLVTSAQASPTSELALAVQSCEDLLALNVTGSERERMDGGFILLEVLLFSALASVLLVQAVHRHNRFERQSFINTFVLLNRTVNEEKQKRGEGRDLLALFSNPAAPQQLQLRPLQLGQELKFLMRSVPPSSLACEPAASLVDVEAAIQRCNPSLLFFSGHSFAGSLAFELPNGRIELPPPNLFISKLQLATRLHCCFLNGCRTGELGHQICSQLPDVQVICWASVAEDAAARSFALGFYDAVGAMLASGDKVQIELAFWAGLEHFSSDGFRLGDPADYLHPPGHPHTLHPVFSPPCKGCTPPVHGRVQLLRASPTIPGTVEALRLEPGGANGEAFCWDAVAADGLRAKQDASPEVPKSPVHPRDSRRMSTDI